jgi:hypothetical protein
MGRQQRAGMILQKQAHGHEAAAQANHADQGGLPGDN